MAGLPGPDGTADWQAAPSAQAPVPCVVVTGNHPMALTLIRSLGRRGIPVFVLLSTHNRHRSAAFYRRLTEASRFVKRCVCFDERDYEAGLLETLLCLGRRQRQRLPLLPASDKDMDFVSRHRGALLGFYAFNMPAHETMEMLLNKRRFYEYAAEHDIPIPRTFLPKTAADLTAGRARIRYPCIIKPPWRDEAWTTRFGNRKVIVCDDFETLQRQFSEVVGLVPQCVVQEVVPGPEQNIYCAFALLDAASNILSLLVGRKLRQYPPGFGNTSLIESVHDERVADLTATICRRIGLVGYASIEFKYDVRDKEFRVLEITAGRWNRQAGITEAAGVPLVGQWYASCLGKTVAPVQDYRPHVKWVSEINELRSLPFYVRDGLWSPLRWLASYRHTRRFELFARDDLGPMLKALWPMRFKSPPPLPPVAEAVDAPAVGEYEKPVVGVPHGAGNSVSR